MAGEGEPASVKSDNSKAPRSGRRRKITIIIVAVVLIVGIVAGIAYYFKQRQYVTTDDAFIDGQILRIAAQQTGRLTEVAVEGNAKVAEGDLLARIDGASASADVALARAQAAEAEAAIGEAEAGIVQAKASVEAAQSTMKGANITAANARTKADRFSKLAQKSGQSTISTQALDDLLADAEQAEASAAAAQKNVATAKAGVSVAEATRASAKAQLLAAQAGEASAQVGMDHLTITAPINGQVVQINVNKGSYVTPGTQIMALVPDDLFITANFKETQLARIKPGQKVDVTVAAFPDVAFKGTVQSIQHGAGQAFQLLPPQNATGNFVSVVQRVPVRISIDSPSLADYAIGPGMSVVPSIRLED